MDGIHHTKSTKTFRKLVWYKHPPTHDDDDVMATNVVFHTSTTSRNSRLGTRSRDDTPQMKHLVDVAQQVWQKECRQDRSVPVTGSWKWFWQMVQRS